MYTVEEFDKEKTKILKYILYKKRSENEVRRKFAGTIEENLLEDVIEYLKEARYIDDKEYIRKTVNNFMALKNLSLNLHKPLLTLTLVQLNHQILKNILHLNMQ